MGLRSDQRAGDGGGDALAGHVRQFLVHELRRVGAALADQAGIEPLLGDALQLPEQVELGIFARVAPLGVDQALGQVEQQRGGPHVVQVFQTEFDALADDAFVLRDGGADQIGRQLQDGIVIELGGEALLGQFDAVAGDAREADFERVAVGADGLHLDGLAGRLRRSDHRLGREVERNPQHVGVFDVEQVVFVEVVGLAAERPANDLLAEELRAEGAHAENVGDGVGVPTFREHGDRDDAADRFAEPALLADGVHDLAEQFLIGDVFGLLAVAGALDDLAAEAVDLVGRPCRGNCRPARRRIRSARCRSTECGAGRAGCRVRRNSGTAPGARSPAWLSRLRSLAGSLRCSRRPAWRWTCCCRRR